MLQSKCWNRHHFTLLWADPVPSSLGLSSFGPNPNITALSTNRLLARLIPMTSVINGARNKEYLNSKALKTSDFQVRPSLRTLHDRQVAGHPCWPSSDLLAHYSSVFRASKRDPYSQNNDFTEKTTYSAMDTDSRPKIRKQKLKEVETPRYRKNKSIKSLTNDNMLLVLTANSTSHPHKGLTYSCTV